MMLLPTPYAPVPIQTLGDVSAFNIEITAAQVSGGTAYHTFFVVATAGCKVYWGDGASSTLSTGTNTCTHTYVGAGQYLILIRGAHTTFYHYSASVSATPKKVVKGLKLYSGVTSCEYMWYGCEHEKFILSRSFKVHSGITSTRAMFYNAKYFNSEINHWDISHVTTMANMFQIASYFNQDISSWDTSSVTNMSYVFYYATAFNKNLGNWNVRNVTNAGFMFTSSALSSSNYDALLNGWASQAVKSGVTLNVGTTKYTSAGVAARSVLAGTHGWTITDGGLAV